jgi:hypothetical protein
MLGYQRVGPELKVAIGNVLNAMLGNGELVRSSEAALMRS